MDKQKRKHSIGYGIVTVVLWGVLWQVLAWKINQTIFLPAPAEVWYALKRLLVSQEFYQSILHSLGNIVKGTCLAGITGIILASGAAAIPFFKVFLGFPIRIMQATPVASFTILALFWINSTELSVLVSFLMVLPLIYTNVLAGIEAANPELLEMAQVFQVRWYHKLRFIYIPEVLPYFLSGCSVAAGLAWKSGIAAEVIGVVRNTIGNHLYQSKIYMEMPELFAWTVVIIGISILFERGLIKLVYLLEKRLLQAEKIQDGRWKTRKIEKMQDSPAEPQKIRMDKVTKHYDDVLVCKDFSMQIAAGEIVALMGASGAGKTTVMRLLLRLEQPNTGRIEADEKKMSVVFQEDRLCETVSVYHNLAMVCRTREQCNQIEPFLGCLGLDGCSRKKVIHLSGGMKRRVAIARAFLAGKQVLLLDEPLKGLDEVTKASVMQFMKDNMHGKTVLFITHEESEAKYFGCRIIRM